MAYRFINENKDEFGLRWLLNRMNIHPNAYYNYSKQKKAEYNTVKASVCASITRIFHEVRGIIGHRSMRIFLQREGTVLSKTTVHKYMNKELNLHCICRRKKPRYKKGHAHKVFSNLLNQNFQVAEPNRSWCTDFTYIYLTNGTVRYNCTIINLYDRSVVASENGSLITSELAIKTLDKAIKSSGCKAENIIIHSDQGSQFTSLEFITYCEKKGITQSMSHAGCPYDNAPMERYYNTLKAELIYQFNFNTVAELDYAVAEYSYGWYNQIRPHSHDGYLTPFEKRFGLK